jgi:hypothetical protein
MSQKDIFSFNPIEHHEKTSDKCLQWKSVECVFKEKKYQDKNKNFDKENCIKYAAEFCDTYAKLSTITRIHKTTGLINSNNDNNDFF